MANTGHIEQPYRKRLFRWEWLSVAFMVIISFSSVLGASTLALRFSLAKTLNANVQTQRGANYGTDPRDTLAFAPLNPDILLEATADSAYLRITPSPEPKLALEEINVAGFFLLPTTASNTPTQIPALPTSEPLATGEKPTNTPTVTQPTATATAVSPTAPAPFQTLTPTPTPQPSTTAVSPTYTPVSPTATAVPPATNTATPRPTATPTLLPSSTPTLRPTATPTLLPSSTPTLRPTATVTPLPTHTATPSPSATATPVLQPTSTPTPSMTPTATTTATPTSTATPTPTATLEYQRLQPILNCVIHNGDDTVTVYFGYQNNNAYIVTVVPGANNRFFPAPTNRGQPAFFQPGLHSFVFSVTVNKSLDTLFWYLDDNTTPTWPGSPYCP